MKAPPLWLPAPFAKRTGLPGCLDERLGLDGPVLEAAFAIHGNRAVGLQGDDFPVANPNLSRRRVFVSLAAAHSRPVAFIAHGNSSLVFLGFRRLLARFPQLGVEARLAHAACLAAVALVEMMAAGGTIELSSSDCVAV